MLCVSGSDNKSDAEQGETKKCAADEFPTCTHASTKQAVMMKIKPHARDMGIQLKENGIFGYQHYFKARFRLLGSIVVHSLVPIKL